MLQPLVHGQTVVVKYIMGVLSHCGHLQVKSLSNIYSLHKGRNLVTAMHPVTVISTVLCRETEVRPRRRRRRSAEEDDGTSCGLMWLFKECLKLLPSFEQDDDSEEISEEERAVNNREMLKWGAQQIVSLIIPITVCMTAVVITELSVFIDEPSGTGTM